MSLIDPVESLVLFAKEIKPFHTKIMDIIVEYIHSDNINVVMTEQLEWFQRNDDGSIEPGIQLNFDRAVVCDEGFGLTAMGTIHPNQDQLAENPNYDPLDVNYRPELDRNQPEYEPSELVGASPTELQVSTPFLPYVETYRESYWNNADCPVPSECMVIPIISDSQSVNLTINNAFCNNFHQTYDSINAFNFEFGEFSDCRYPFRLSQVVQEDYPGSPATYGVAKAHFHMDRSKWYWEIRIDSYTSDPEDIRVGILEFDPLTIEPPFGITNNTTPLGDLPDHVGLAGNGDLYVGGVLSAGYSAGYGAGDVVGVAFDVDSNTVQFYINGVAAGALINNAVDITNLRGIFPSDESSPPWEEDENASPPIDYKVYAPGVSMILDNSQTAVTILAEADNIQYSIPIGFSLLEAGEICEGYIALPAPVLTEVTPIPAYSFVHTPQYVFNSDQAGSIEYGGVGVGDLTEAVVGDNTVSYSVLSAGYYDDFSIIVTSYENCRSTTLNVTPFTITSPLLNLYPTGVAGFSLEKLEENATRAIRVRRSFDSAEQDIGFATDTYWLDEDELLDFVTDSGAQPTAHGFVVKWYNQQDDGANDDLNLEPVGIVPAQYNGVTGNSAWQSYWGSDYITPKTNWLPYIVRKGVIERFNYNGQLRPVVNMAGWYLDTATNYCDNGRQMKMNNPSGLYDGKSYVNVFGLMFTPYFYHNASAAAWRLRTAGKHLFSVRMSGDGGLNHISIDCGGIAPAYIVTNFRNVVANNSSTSGDINKLFDRHNTSSNLPGSLQTTNYPIRRKFMYRINKADNTGVVYVESYKNNYTGLTLTNVLNGTTDNIFVPGYVQQNSVTAYTNNVAHTGFHTLIFYNDDTYDSSNDDIYDLIGVALPP